MPREADTCKTLVVISVSHARLKSPENGSSKKGMGKMVEIESHSTSLVSLT